MKRISFLSAIALFSLSVVFISCGKDEEDQPKPANTETITIDASAYDKWVYFSFEKGTTIEISDYKTSTEWDLGFHRFDLRVNCGTSGSGQGGTYATGKTDYTAVTTAPESGYSLNDSISIAVDMSTIPPVMETVPGDTVLASWVIMTYGQTGPEYTYSNEIFVVKTATAKFAKVWLKDYFNDEGKSGHVTMKYSYQPDGSTKLD
ncbi:MAG: HmuY family protein [Bacteroidales bacterium]|nr:HmuY family protein [Bacteroidales bacterium]